MSKFTWILAAMLMACDTGEAESTAEPNCGDELTCADGEFCLARIPSGGSTGDEEYTCETLPDGCDDIGAMCFDDPACVPDWAADFCPDAISSGCSSAFGYDEAFCQD